MDRQTEGSRPGRPRRDRARRGVIIVLLNASAGIDDGRRTAEAVAARFLAAGLDAEVVVLGRGQDPAHAARSASTRATVVVAAGGDGTVSRVAAGLVGTRSALGVLPMGTFNHFAKDLRIPLDLDGAIATIAARHVVRIDVGRVNDRVFINNCSIGIYPSIVDARQELQRQGHGKWLAFAIATWRVLRRYRGLRVRISAAGRQFQWPTPFVFVGNNAYEVDGLNLGSRAALDCGRLVAYLAPRVRTRQLPMLLLRALLSRATHAGDFEIVSAAELSVGTRRARRVLVAIDGETTTLTTPLHFQIGAGALHVLRPRA
jgi:diacylglycerol kinase family enzyme